MLQRDAQSENRISDELKLIPRWAIGGAILAFTAAQYYFWVVLPVHQHHPSSVPAVLHVYLILSWGALVALYVLMIGYISNDAPRRRMSPLPWMVCVGMPGGIGAVLYFLMRQPIVSACPACGGYLETDYHYCPQCAYQIVGCCRNCYRSSRVTDIHCVHCGHDLTADHPPARLHAFTE